MLSDQEKNIMSCTGICYFFFFFYKIPDQEQKFHPERQVIITVECRTIGVRYDNVRGWKGRIGKLAAPTA